MTVGERIRAARKAKGLTQKELGEACGIAEPTIRRYELGKLNPKFETLEKIAKHLDTTAAALYGVEIVDENESVISLLTQFNHTEEEITTVTNTLDSIRETIKPGESLEVSWNGSIKIYHSDGSSTIAFPGFGGSTEDEIRKHGIAAILEDILQDTLEDSTLELIEEVFYTGKRGALLSCFDKLNDVGQEKAVENLEDLAKIPDYQKKNPDSDIEK